MFYNLNRKKDGVAILNITLIRGDTKMLGFQRKDSVIINVIPRITKSIA